MRRLLTRAIFGVAIIVACPVHAYRPFDGTDADVAQTGEVELELGPVEYLHANSDHILILPALIANYGFISGFEFVAEGRQAIQVDSAANGPRSQRIDAALSIKEILRNGCLQGVSGLSIANEWSILAPDTNSQQNWGGEISTIFSKRWSASTIHVNVVNELSKTRHYVTSIGPILEGPYTWRIRPVAEFIVARGFGNVRLSQRFSESALLGAIGRVRDNLSVDAALRYSRSVGSTEQEVRVGLTWLFEVSKSRESHGQ
jgi:hypothetical protein